MKKERAQPSELLDRQPPCNIALEREVLAAIIVGRDSDKFAQAVKDAVAYLNPADFYSGFHKEVFALLKQAVEHGVPLTSKGCLWQWIRDTKGAQWADENWAAMLADIVLDTPAYLHIEYYSRILRTVTARRHAIHIACDLVRTAWNDGVHPARWAQQAVQRLERFRERVLASKIPE